MSGKVVADAAASHVPDSHRHRFGQGLVLRPRAGGEVPAVRREGQRFDPAGVRPARQFAPVRCVQQPDIALRSPGGQPRGIRREGQRTDFLAGKTAAPARVPVVRGEDPQSASVWHQRGGAADGQVAAVRRGRDGMYHARKTAQHDALFRVDVQDLNERALRKRQRPAAAKHCQGLAPVPSRSELRQRLAALRVPDAHRAVPAGGKQPRSVRGKGEIGDFFFGGRNPQSAMAAIQVPDLQRAIAAGGDQFVLRGGKGQGADVAAVASKQVDVPAGLRIPERDAAIVGVRDGQDLAVRRKSHGGRICNGNASLHYPRPGITDGQLAATDAYRCP